MDLRHTLLRHTLMPCDKDMLEAKSNEVKRKELHDELKEKGLEEEKVALQDEAQSDLLYSIELWYPDLNLHFFGPAVKELIGGFEELRAASAIAIPEEGHGMQDENNGQAIPGGGDPPTGQV
ncbi:hypothetical protein ACOSQ3_022815 [Xanthoceras sorbifolium]